MRYKMIIQYDGSRYKGWQSQKNTDATIQGKIQNILSLYAGYPVEVQGSGRTDAGVHAREQVASFELQEPKNPTEMIAYLNHYLPEDIGVMELKEMPPRFHARLSAEQKTYVYRIWNSDKPNVFQRKWMYTITEPLDIAKMREGAKYFVGTHDFASFCAVKKSKKSTVRTISEIKIETFGEEIRFSITGNGFLHHMVRILVGTLVEIGLGKRMPEEIAQLLNGNVRADAGITMPAKGLILWQVTYPEEYR